MNSTRLLVVALVAAGLAFGTREFERESG